MWSACRTRGVEQCICSVHRLGSPSSNSQGGEHLKKKDTNVTEKCFFLPPPRRLTPLCLDKTLLLHAIRKQQPSNHCTHSQVLDKLDTLNEQIYHLSYPMGAGLVHVRPERMAGRLIGEGKCRHAILLLLLSLFRCLVPAPRPPTYRNSNKNPHPSI